MQISHRGPTVFQAIFKYGRLYIPIGDGHPCPILSRTPAKNTANRAKHGVDFELAAAGALDPLCVIAEDRGHGDVKGRSFWFRLGGGRDYDGPLHLAQMRIFGARYWRKGGAIYEKAGR